MYSDVNFNSADRKMPANVATEYITIYYYIWIYHHGIVCYVGMFNFPNTNWILLFPLW